MFSLSLFLKAAEALDWQKVPVKTAFPEIESVLKCCAEHFFEYYDYYSVLCGSLEDFMKYYMTKRSLYGVLLYVNNFNVEEVNHVMDFTYEITKSMESGCTFVEALEDWDIIEI